MLLVFVRRHVLISDTFCDTEHAFGYTLSLNRGTGDCEDKRDETRSGDTMGRIEFDADGLSGDDNSNL